MNMWLHTTEEIGRFRRYSPSKLVHVVVQPLSHVRLFATLWTAACKASLSITISQSLLKLMSIESVAVIQPSHPLSSPSPPALNLFQHPNFSNESALPRWPKY